jgi:hypothetical protein
VAVVAIGLASYYYYCYYYYGGVVVVVGAGPFLVVIKARVWFECQPQQ